MRLGLYRIWDPLLGESARVDRSAGDAAPFLSRRVYEWLGFEPAFDNLPCQADYERSLGGRASSRSAGRRLRPRPLPLD